MGRSGIVQHFLAGAGVLLLLFDRGITPHYGGDGELAFSVFPGFYITTHHNQPRHRDTDIQQTPPITPKKEDYFIEIHEADYEGYENTTHYTLTLAMAQGLKGRERDERASGITLIIFSSSSTSTSLPPICRGDLMLLFDHLARLR